MAYGDGLRVVVAEFGCADERRTVYLRRIVDGMVTVGEESSGGMTRLAYGDSFHRCELHVEEGSIVRLLQELTGGSDISKALSVLFADSEVSLADLMDELDAEGVGYWFSSLGDASGPTLRRSGAV